MRILIEQQKLFEISSSTLICILEEGEGDPEISAASIHLGLRKGRPQAK